MINRQRVSLTLATICLLIGIIKPWYRLPPEVLNTFGTNLDFTHWGKIINLICLIFSVIWLIKLRSQFITRCLVWFSLILVLLFPYWLNTWHPDIALIANSYFNNTNRVDRHMISNFPEVQAQWKQNIVLARMTPQNSVVSFKIDSSTFFNPSSLDQILIEGLGFTNGFFSFIGGGWPLTILGILLQLLGAYLVFIDRKLKALISDLRKIYLPLIVISFIILISLFIPPFTNYKIEENFSLGNYEKVVSMSEDISAVYPNLKIDKSFLTRLARASFYSGQPNDSLVFFSKGIEHYINNNYLLAIKNFERALEVNPQLSLARDYLATTLVNRGVELFNQKKISSAAQYFDEALAIFPDHVQASYDLMIAKVVNGEYEQSARVGKRIIEVQDYFQLPSLTIKGQSYLHSAWANFKDDELEETWQRYRQSVDTSAWES